MLRRSVGAGIARPVACHGRHECYCRSICMVAAASAALIWGQRGGRGRTRGESQSYAGRREGSKDLTFRGSGVSALDG